MPANRRCFANTLGLLCAVALAGCSPAGNHATIHGSVKLDGQPLATGAIRFIPIEGTQGVLTGGDIKDGQYMIPLAKGPAIGRNRVEIQAMRGTGKRRHDPMLGPDQTAEVFENMVAPRFNTDSTLEVAVDAGDNKADFDVQSE